MLPNGKVVVDEVCRCGHLKSEHTDTFQAGHGRGMHMARIDGCDCIKFTWKDFIYSDTN